MKTSRVTAQARKKGEEKSRENRNKQREMCRENIFNYLFGIVFKINGYYCAEQICSCLEFFADALSVHKIARVPARMACLWIFRHMFQECLKMGPIINIDCLRTEVRNWSLFYSLLLDLPVMPNFHNKLSYSFQIVKIIFGPPDKMALSWHGHFSFFHRIM